MPIIKKIKEEEKVEYIWGVGDSTPIVGEINRNKIKKRKRKRTKKDDITEGEVYQMRVQEMVKRLVVLDLWTLLI